MPAIHFAILLLAVIFLAAATIWMTGLVGGSLMPGWAAAIGPILLALVLILHYRGRKK